MSIKQNIGVIGMGTMGCNLSINIERHGYRVSIFNRSKNKTDEIMMKNPRAKIFPFYSIKDFVFSLEKPRKIILMVKSGISTDEAIQSIVPYLEKDDILIDGGNSFYKDTIRRHNELLLRDIFLIGSGISGGAYGALNGPSIMPGGHKEAYNKMKYIFKNIAANFAGEPCVTYIGPDGSGHYVKMIHNSIEYSDMQLISESYFLLKLLLDLNNPELSDIFSTWNSGELNSYLIDITYRIFLKKDENGHYLIDMILDAAKNKETGKWASQSALELEEPLTVITESVFARYLSSLKCQRTLASRILLGPNVRKISINISEFIEKIRKALYLSKIITYAQGFSQLKKASIQNNWNLNFGKISKIFRAGCIIRAKLLDYIIDAYMQDPFIDNLLLSPYFKEISNDYQKDLRDVVSYSIQQGISIPAFTSAISYYDGYRSIILPANLIQAQRDYFGIHGFQRIDKPGTFHAKWE